MTSAARRIIIIGGGFSGMSAAIECAKQGAEVDLVEIDPGWRSYGAGISLGGATLRALGTLGVLQRFLQEGSGHDGAEVFTPDGRLLAQLPTPRLAGPDVPGCGAIMRPVLAKMLADATRAAGVRVRLGCTFTAIDQREDAVDVAFSDGTRGQYDLLIGADGLYSKVRETVFPDAPQPRYSGQGVWRAVLPRPAEVQGTIMWVGPKVKTGVNPVSKQEMYLFVTEDRPVNERIEPARFVPMLQELLAPFSAPLIQQVRAQLGEASQIIYRPLEGLLVPQPWYRGRVVLIGDTVHATTPHLASGACIGIEDGLVLAEELGRAAGVEAALAAFQQRRWERCRMVVENSARLGEIEATGGDKAEHARIMRDSMIALAQPI
ncbi:FAD-dependent oxidoreductase [Methylibium rhizosphaerae]|jgi:2-polyprenyl-6-methoxyphenol hydroxylase-like FAD-dependent oxidoreductase|uniref:FAD-dependent oxidoreductase n=1 Tax=Methylibium rhizosphaerae TaxID=2570323 RepID=UPI00112AE235|nr:FAD-dependent oxidoreductase [Methylibium rhizosphaerae]